MNWFICVPSVPRICLFAQVRVHNYVLFAADAEAHTFFKELGAPSFHYADTVPINACVYVVFRCLRSMHSSTAEAEACYFFFPGMSCHCLMCINLHNHEQGGKQLFSDPSTDNSAGLRGVLGVGSDRRDELWAASVPGGASAIAAKAVRWHRHGQLWWYRWRFIAEVKWPASCRRMGAGSCHRQDVPHVHEFLGMRANGAMHAVTQRVALLWKTIRF